MMNPSQAVEKNSDKTVNKVLLWAIEEKYKEVSILNCLPFYETNSRKLGKKVKELEIYCENEFKQIMKKNFDNIEKAIKDEDSTIFVATGKPVGKIVEKYIKEVYKLLDGKKIFFIEKISEDNYFRHPLYSKFGSCYKLKDETYSYNL